MISELPIDDQTLNSSTIVKVGLQFKTRKSHRQTGTDQIDNRSSRVGYGVPGKYRKEADLPQTLIGGFLTHNNSISIAT